MRLLRNPLKAVIIMVCLVVSFSFLSLGVMAYEHMPENTEPYEIYPPAPDYVIPPDTESHMPPVIDEDFIPVRGDPFANEVIRLINIERFHYGLPPVEVHSVMTEAARKRAQEGLRVEDAQFVNHTRPSGRQWHTVFPEVNISMASLGRAGENVARGFNTPEEVVWAWMNSPGHRYNILSPEWSTTGAWSARNDWGRIDIVQLFRGNAVRFTLIETELSLMDGDAFQMHVISNGPTAGLSLRWGLRGSRRFGEHVSINEYGLIIVSGLEGRGPVEEFGAASVSIYNSNGSYITTVTANIRISV